MQTPICHRFLLRVLAYTDAAGMGARDQPQSPRHKCVGRYRCNGDWHLRALWTRSPLDELGYRGWCCPQQDLGRQRHTGVASTAEHEYVNLCLLGWVRSDRWRNRALSLGLMRFGRRGFQRWMDNAPQPPTWMRDVAQVRLSFAVLHGNDSNIPFAK